MSLKENYLESKPQLKNAIASVTPIYTEDYTQLERVFLNWLHRLTPGTTVLIYGDYDVDGMLSSTLAHLLLQRLGIKSEIYLPHRVEDGYGFKASTYYTRGLDKYNALLILDSGSNQWDFLSKLTIPVLILDHHEVQISIPENQLILSNPHLHYHKEGDFCTVSMVYLCIQIVKEIYTKVSDLHIIATIYTAIALLADQVKVLNHNRIILQEGLYYLNQGYSGALEWLKFELNLGIITEQHLSWKLIPVLNAAGRLLLPNLVPKLLLSSSISEQRDIARQLCLLNNSRRELTQLFLQEALTQDLSSNVLVVWNKTWLPGLVGIIAGQLSSQFNKPVFAFTYSELHKCWEGSGRSQSGVSILQIAIEVKEYLEPNFGGHAQAMGLRTKDPELLLQKLKNHKFVVNSVEDVPKFRGDLFNEKEILDLLTLRPFGNGNPQPVFKFSGIITSIRQLKSGYQAKLVDAFGEYKCYIPQGLLTDPKPNDKIEGNVEIEYNEQFGAGLILR